ncbi:Pr6Pr family membrane protein [uncultured Arthrobacter sp.]|uniref:Pr6Pr family membrane protein n=1 Tax=uncultured Arthrobacter sp. TaxID=114050 RepID=UPI002626F9CA|nr:Pr6Pr family membrane protein [uncultured Arthrobacter sp.]
MIRPVIRLISAVTVGTAVVATFLDTASRTTINPFNFFGFFTMQSNIMTALVIFVAAVFELGRRRTPAWLVPVRAATTTYMVVVGVVYNSLLAGLAGGVDLAWANWVLHVAFPIYALLDWLLSRDRRRLPFSTIGLILIYPLTWCAVVLVRGATDGWVPYPFLSPTTGYGSVTVYVVVIAVAFAAFGALIIWVSRVSLRGARRSARNR